MNSSVDMTRGSAQILEVGFDRWLLNVVLNSTRFPSGEAVDVSVGLYILNVLEVKEHVSMVHYWLEAATK